MEDRVSSRNSTPSSEDVTRERNSISENINNSSSMLRVKSILIVAASQVEIPIKVKETIVHRVCTKSFSCLSVRCKPRSLILATAVLLVVVVVTVGALALVLVSRPDNPFFLRQPQTCFTWCLHQQTLYGLCIHQIIHQHSSLSIQLTSRGKAIEKKVFRTLFQRFR